MKEEFENLDSVAEMLAYLVENNDEEVHRPKTPDLAGELNLLGVQTFLRLFAYYKALGAKERDELEQCAEAFNDPDTDALTRQSSLAYVYELFFPETKKSEKEIVRKNETKVYPTPCEDCTNSPTHLVVFKTENRTEEHFLCEECEKAARKEDDDGDQE